MNFDEALNAASSEKKVDDLDQANETIESQQEMVVKNSVTRSFDLQAEEEKKVKRLAKRYKVEEDFVRRNKEDLFKNERVNQIDYKDLVKKNPAVAEYMSNPSNAAISFNDYENLKQLEKTARQAVPNRIDRSYARSVAEAFTQGKKIDEPNFFGQDTATSILSSGLSLTSSALKVPEVALNTLITATNKFSDVMGQSRGLGPLKDDQKIPQIKDFRPDTMINYLDGVTKNLELEDMNKGIVDSFSKGNISDGLNSLWLNSTAQIPQLAVLAFTGGGAGLGFLAGTSAADAHDEAIKDGESYETAALRGTIFGIAEGVGEKFGTASILKRFRKPLKEAVEIASKGEGESLVEEGIKKYLKSELLKDVGQEAGSEVLTSSIQEGTDYLLGRTDSLTEAGKRVLDAGLVGGFFGGGLGAVRSATSEKKAKKLKNMVSDFDKAHEEIVKEFGQVSEDLSDHEKLIELGKIAKNVTELSPEGPVTQIVNSINQSEENPKVYMQGDDFKSYWSNLGKDSDEIIQELSEEAQESFNEAEQNGEDVEIGLAEFVEKFAQTEHYEKMVEFVKTKADGMTFSEAKEKIEELSGVIQEVDREANLKEDSSDPVGKVKKDIKSQLKNAGLSDGISSAVAILQGERYKTRAKILKRDPLELYKSDNIKINRFDSPDDILKKEAGEKQFRQNKIEDDFDAGALGSIEGEEIFSKPLLSKDGKVNLTISKKSKDTMAIDSINVKEGSRGKGFGSKILSQVEQKALELGLKSIELEADPLESKDRKENRGRLEEFYKKNGYRVVSRNKAGIARMKKDVKEKKFFQERQTAQQDELGFYSQLKAEVEKINFKSMPAKNLLSQLKKIPGIKPDELEFTGLKELLETTEGKVFKEDILTLLENGGLQFEEIVKGDVIVPLAELEISKVPRSQLDAYSQGNMEAGDNLLDVYVLPGTGLNILETDNGDFLLENGNTDQPIFPEDVDMSDHQGLSDTYFNSLDSAKMGAERHIQGIRQTFEDETRQDDSTKFSQWTLPGGENYKEVLLRLPEKKNDNDKTLDQIRKIESAQEAIRLEQDEHSKALFEVEKKLGFDHSIPLSKFGKALDEFYKDNRDNKDLSPLLDKKEDLEKTFRGMEKKKEDLGRKLSFESPYQSAHWDETNVLAHMRLQDFIDKDGKKTLLVEEIQSDWHQAGRKKGYRSALNEQIAEQKRKEIADIKDQIEGLREQREVETIKAEKESPILNEINKLNQKIEENQKERAALDKEFTEGIHEGTLSDERIKEIEIDSMVLREESKELRGQRRQLILKEDTELKAKKDEISKRLGIDDLTKKRLALSDEVAKLTSTVPDAPFKQTDAWATLAFKRILRMAVEQGYDSVSITPGDVQAERYDLSKQLDEVRYKKSKDGTYWIQADGKQGTVFNERGIKESELENYIGKEVAQKIVNDEGSSKEGTGFSQLSGLDLKVGGEGMIGFYDKILPKAIQKYVKKLDKSVKVGVDKIGEELEFAQVKLNDFEKSGDDSREIYTYRTGSDKYEIYKEKSGVTLYKNSSTIEGNLDNTEQAIEILNKTFKTNADLTQKVWNVPITDKLRDEVLGGQTLFQDQRGQIRIGNNSINIDLFKNADPSTILHEFSHLWLNQMEQDYNYLKGLDQLDAEQELFINDMDTVLKYLGVESFDQIETDHHELWADSMEKYFSEGNAPIPELTSIFEQFKKWIESVYVQLKKLNAPLTDEVRDVMDRLVISNQEIELAGQDIDAMFEDELLVNMKKDDLERYKKALSEAKESAKSKLMAEFMDEYDIRKSPAYKKELAELRKEIKEDLKREPIYNILSFLSEKKIKLSKTSLAEVASPEQLKVLRKYYTVQDHGIDVGVFSDAHGYDSSIDLVNEMLTTPSIDDRVEFLAMNEMNKRHPELVRNKEKLKEIAEEYVHNEAREKLLRLELEFIAKDAPGVFKKVLKNTISRVPESKLMKKQAKAIIDKKKLKDIAPHKYLQAEKRMSKQAAKALTDGDINLAFEFKRKELLNHLLYKESLKVKDFRIKFDKMVKTLKKSDKDISKNRDINFIYAARAIVEPFVDFGKKIDVQKYINIVKRYDPETADMIGVFVESSRIEGVEFKELSYEQLQRLQGSVKAMLDLAKESMNMIVDGKQVKKEDVQKELVEQFNKTNKNRKKITEAVDEAKKTEMTILGFKSRLRRVESFIDKLDIGDPTGPFRKYIWNKVSEASNIFRDKKALYFQKFQNILQEYGAKHLTKKDLSFKIESKELDYTFKDKAELLGMLLHIGNPSNKRKLVIGHGWGAVDADGNVDFKNFDAFLERIFSENIIKKEDMDFLQRYWDLMEELKPAAQKAHKKLYGFFFSEITAETIKTPFGDYKGGYVPAMIDKFKSINHQKREDAESLFEQSTSFMFPQTSNGFTKQRVNEFAEPLMFDLRIFPMHLDKVLRFTYIQPAATEVYSLINKGPLANRLNEVDESLVNKMLVPWLQRAVQQKVESPDTVLPEFSGFFRNLRTKTSLARMVGNVINTLQQFTGFAISAVKVKPRYLVSAFSDYIFNHKETTEIMKKKSLLMKNRIGSNVIETKQKVEKILLNPSKFETAEEFMVQHGFVLQEVTQSIVDSITWTGAYNQAIADGLSEKEAVRAADSAVRLTQGSFDPEDISSIEAGSALHRLFTMFYSYFNMQANLLGTEFQNIANKDMGLRDGAGRALYVYTMAFVMPAFLSELLIAGAGKGIDQDDDDEYMDDLISMFFGSQLRAGTALFPFVGQIAQVGINQFDDKWYNDRITLSPAVAEIENAVKLPSLIYREITDDARDKDILTSSLSVIGLVTKFPAGALAKPGRFLIDVKEGNQKPQDITDYTKGIITGRSGK